MPETLRKLTIHVVSGDTLTLSVDGSAVTATVPPDDSDAFTGVSPEEIEVAVGKALGMSVTMDHEEDAGGDLLLMPGDVDPNEPTLLP